MKTDRLSAFVQRMAQQRPALPTKTVDAFVTASQSDSLPREYLDEVFELAQREGLSDEALIELGNKAARKTMSPVTLARSKLSDDAMDFLCRSPQAAIAGLQRALESPSKSSHSKTWHEVYLLGLAGEFVLQTDLHRLLPLHELVERQFPIRTDAGNSDIDFLLQSRTDDLLFGVEVKAYSPNTWNRLFSVLRKFQRGESLSASDEKSFDKFVQLERQLKAIYEYTGQRPYLAVLDELTPKQRGDLKHWLEVELNAYHAVPELVFLSTSKVRLVAGELWKGLQGEF